MNDAYLARMDEGFRALGVAEKGTARASSGSERLEREVAGFGALREPADADAFFFEPFSTISTRAAPGDASAADRWLRGPVDPAGARVKLSDLPLTCASLAPAGDGVVVGGTDHSVRLVTPASATWGGKNEKKKNVEAGVVELRGGHGEWVTCVARDATRGLVVSGGMDSKVCAWTQRQGASRGSNSSRGSRGSSFLPPAVLEGHFGSVSDLAARDGLAASASYDKTVRLWRLATPKPGKPGPVATLRGHRAPALRLALFAAREERSEEEKVSAADSDAAAPWRLASGDRDGAVLRWDAETASLVSSRDAHEGHCTSLRWVLGADPHATPLLASGGQDGAARFWDDRQERPVAAVDAHRQTRTRDGKRSVGAGAVSDIAQCAGSRRVVTAGADGDACVLDLRARGNAAAAEFELEKVSSHALGDFAYSLCVAPGADVAFAGDGSGNVHCVDVAGVLSGGNPSVAFALGAHRGATRALVATRDGRLCAAGDDGCVASYEF